MKFYLIVAKGKKQGFPIPIEVDLFLIGSSKECQLRSVHEKIGDQHCALVKRERKVFIRDLNSGEATLVNGDVMPPSEEWPLHVGDLIEIGPLKFMIQFREKALSRRDLEEWALKCLDSDSSRKVAGAEQLDQLTSFTKEAANASEIAEALINKLNARKGIVKGRLRIAREGNITIVRINDVYMVEEAELNLLKKELHDNLNRPNLRVLLDMKNVKRMSTTAVEMLGEFHEWLKSQASRLAMCRIKTDIQEMILSFDHLEGVKIFPDKPAGVQSSW